VSQLDLTGFSESKSRVAVPIGVELKVAFSQRTKATLVALWKGTFTLILL